MNAIRKFRQHQRAHPLQHLVNIQADQFGQAVRRQQTVHQRLQAVRFFDDHLRVFPKFIVRKLAFQQLRRTANAA